MCIVLYDFLYQIRNEVIGEVVVEFDISGDFGVRFDVSI